jgi:hypothetical protein
MNTQENNKLIAEFMGARRFMATNEFELYGLIPIIEDGDNEKHFFCPHEMKFNTDWNWLMEVVEKIESLGYDVFINTCVCKVSDVGQNMFEDIECFVNNNKIQATYNACVEFIQWYNEQK